MPLRIVVAPSGFKESLDAPAVADHIEAGIRRVLPDAVVRKVPLVDGGEGFARALVATTGGTLHDVTVTGPVGEPVASHFGILGTLGAGNGASEPAGTGDGRLAVLEMAAAAGLRLVPRTARDPLATTTYGVGELIGAALDGGASRILVGCGDSGTCDGGAGMAQALGVRLLDEAGREIGRGGNALARLAHIDLAGRDPRLADVRIDVACNWYNVLCGPKGVARVFGPQKGASPEAVEQLAAALDHYAEVIERELGVDVREAPGCGASGGLGAGLQALVGARLRPRYDIVMRYLKLDDLLADADLVFTAEGSLDAQTPRGKVPSEVAHHAKRLGLPVIALAGTLGDGVQLNYADGIDAFESILAGPTTLDDAITHAGDLLENSAERIMNLLMVGRALATRGDAAAAPEPPRVGA